ncbi:1205_t:CDS:2 [Funneliformis mosseae]|uniref:1205_t:CDS:1 n=1 Tax=Funneliformis mosseae TaxID=27381 RepID=A0A9N9AXJ6_FUNMO|nr:1205_t:CDS:2 [Funneliformis mosseae]
MENEVAELSSIWQKRFLMTLKEINNDDMKDEQAQYIADLLSNQESTKSDKGTIAKLLAQILQNKSEKAGSLAQDKDQRLSLKKCQSEIDSTQDEDQRLSLKKCQSKINSTQDEDQKLSLKKHQLEIEEPELPKSKKFEAVTDFTQDEDQGILEELTDFAQDEDRRLSLRERRLSIEERKVKLERERIELMKLKKSLI